MDKLSNRALSTSEYLKLIGVPQLPPKTIAFDPGYDVATVLSHLEQSGHLMSSLKLSMACWQVSSELATIQKINKARDLNVTVCTGGGPFEVACACNKLPEYLDLCAGLGFDRIEAGEGFIDLHLSAKEVLTMARERGLDVHFEVGEKHSGAFTPQVVAEIIEQGKEWLDAGATQLVVEAREDAENVGLFDSQGNLDLKGADMLVEAFGMDQIVFEAPNKSSQFAFIRHYGPEVELCNVRLEEILRVEIYRRGLHSDAFMHDNLRPSSANITSSDLK
jgi:phosphosulfolactate synthase